MELVIDESTKTLDQSSREEIIQNIISMMNLLLMKIRTKKEESLSQIYTHPSFFLMEV